MSIGLELSELKNIPSDFKIGLIESLNRINIEVQFLNTDEDGELIANVFDTKDDFWKLIAVGKTKIHRKRRPAFIFYENNEKETDENSDRYIRAIICIDTLLRATKSNNKKSIFDLYNNVIAEYEEKLIVQIPASD